MAAESRTKPSFFVSRGKNLDYVRVGSAFRRPGTGQSNEIAEISGVYSDSSGIPHVRFELVFHRPPMEPRREGHRVLAAKTFFKRYYERVAI